MIRQCSSQLVKRPRWQRIYLTQETPFAKTRSCHGYESSAEGFAIIRQNSFPWRSKPTIQVQCSFLPRVRSFGFDKASFHSSPTSHASSDAQDVIDSAAATTKWKRNQYRKIQDKFVDGESKQNGMAPNNSLPPLTIDNYDDVQPMWKEMESRVTRRRSLTLAQRGGVSGRRNIRKSDEDVWMAAGVYDIPNDSNDDEADESGETKK